jgi:hypothetical protein
MYTHRMRAPPLCGSLVSLFVAGLGLASAPTPISPATPCPSTPAGNPPAVLTSQYDNARDGYNGNEAVLTAGAVVWAVTNVERASYPPHSPGLRS